MGTRDPLLGFLGLPTIPYIDLHPLVSSLFNHQFLEGQGWASCLEPYA